MKDIKINTPFRKFLYVMSWIGFIGLGVVIAWLIAIGLYTYGRDTVENKERVDGLLNMTYQKFIFIYGIITSPLVVIFFIGSLFGL